VQFHQAAPALQFLRERQRRVRGRGRGQHHGAEALGGELRCELARRLAVEADRFQLRTQRAQVGELIGGRLADRRVEAALALAGTQHVRQADAVRQQARQARGVGQRGQVVVQHPRQEAPQLVDVLVNLPPSLQLGTARRRNARASNWRMMSDA